MSQYVIFSPTEGFWLTDFGWSLSPVEADHFTEEDKAFYAEKPYHLPFSSANDVKVVPLANYTHESYDELAERLGEVVLQELDGNKVAELVYEYTELACKYLGDSLWSMDGCAVDGDELRDLLNDSLQEMECEVLGALYNKLSANNAYYDGVEGFYHQLVH